MKYPYTVKSHLLGNEYWSRKTDFILEIAVNHKNFDNAPFTRILVAFIGMVGFELNEVKGGGGGNKRIFCINCSFY